MLQLNVLLLGGINWSLNTATIKVNKARWPEALVYACLPSGQQTFLVNNFMKQFLIWNVYAIIETLQLNIKYQIASQFLKIGHVQ